jgi:hypothetical protein
MGWLDSEIHQVVVRPPCFAPLICSKVAECVCTRRRGGVNAPRSAALFVQARLSKSYPYFALNRSLPMLVNSFLCFSWNRAFQKNLASSVAAAGALGSNRLKTAVNSARSVSRACPVHALLIVLVTNKIANKTSASYLEWQLQMKAS